jgi:hypothetical protein
MLLGKQTSSGKTHIIIPVVDTINLDQKTLIDKTQFYCQATNIDLDVVGTEVWADACQTYKLYVKKDFYLKCASKSYNIFSLIDSYFIDTIIISSSKDISFNYSRTAKIPHAKYKLVCQALINWFSAANWWWQVFPENRVGIISLTETERVALSKYPRIAKDGQIAITIQGLCSRITKLIQHIMSNSKNNNYLANYTNTSSNTNGNTSANDTGTNIWLRACNPQVSVRHGAKMLAKLDTKLLAIDILDYLVYQTGFKQLCRPEYQGSADFLLFNLPQPISELCLSCFIRGNKLIGLSKTDLSKGHIARLSNLVSIHAQRIIEWITMMWQQLITPNSSYTSLEYEDVVLTIELIPNSRANNYLLGHFKTPEDITVEDIVVDDIVVDNIQLDNIQLWNIEMGYGAWTMTGSKLFTWAELELLTGQPPVIKLIANNKKPK